MKLVGSIAYDPWNLVLALAWSPNGDLLAVATGNSIYLYTMPGLSFQQELLVGAWTTGLVFSPDGSMLATGSRDGDLRLWRNAHDESMIGLELSAQWTAHKKGVNQIAFSPDGRFLASGGNDAIARVWMTGDGSLVQEMIGGTFSVPALAFRPDGKYLAVVNGPLARLRELETGRIGLTLRAEAPLSSLDFSPDGRWIATGNLNGQVEIWEAETAARIDLLDAAEVTSRPPAVYIGQVVYSPDGSLLGAASSDGSIRLWEPASKRLLASLAGQARAATSLAFSPDQSQMASGGLDAALHVWGIP